MVQVLQALGVPHYLLRRVILEDREGVRAPVNGLASGGGFLELPDASALVRGVLRPEATRLDPGGGRVGHFWLHVDVLSAGSGLVLVYELAFFL